ncbi:MAG: hypothetical protein H6662_15625 [Ardenticatenaceae bacterium]|nr:hypothetical protein [Anaerolineales bacterium]MCB8923017.1 hypothetical protein [Ardenticatenaceae bacterium]
MSTADILISPATIWYAPVGEPLPDETTIAYGAAWGGNWAQIAMTAEALAMNRDLSTFEAMIEQSTLPVKRSVTEEKVAFETVIAEFTGDHLVLVMGGTNTPTAAGVGQVGFEELVAGGEVTLDERMWGFEGKYVDTAGAVFPVRVFIYRATSVLNGALTFGKGEQTGIPLRIDALGDLTKPIGQQLLKVQKVTAAATS